MGPDDEFVIHITEETFLFKWCGVQGILFERLHIKLSNYYCQWRTRSYTVYLIIESIFRLEVGFC